MISVIYYIPMQPGFAAKSGFVQITSIKHSDKPHIILRKSGVHYVDQNTILGIQECVCSVAESCPTLCDPMDYHPLGSSIHGVSQVEILEWVAVSF